jgi:hypothetical protein
VSSSTKARGSVAVIVLPARSADLSEQFSIPPAILVQRWGATPTFTHTHITHPPSTKFGAITVVCISIIIFIENFSGATMRDSSGLHVLRRLAL